MKVKPNFAIYVVGITALSLICGSTNARIKRSQSAKIAFKTKNPCPSTGLSKGPCHGYVIDHIVPLACNGPDLSSNMQWQTVDDAKAKDKWERKQCKNG